VATAEGSEAGPVSNADPVASIRWLVVGANGMLGHDLMKVISGTGDEAVGMDLPEVDITSSESVASALEAAKPDVVVNAAAYTAVDAAEEHEHVAMQVNGVGPRHLAEATATRPGVRLVHISTDYVFPGDATSPYSEDDRPSPRSAYGRTKLAGEQSVLATLPDTGFIVRTAWLYGVHGANFVKTMLTLEARQSEVDVVDDQLGQPTWSRDLARQILALIKAEAPAGIYHGTSSGQTTWCGFTREIYRLIGADPERVRPTTTASFPRPAPRPAYSVLGHDRWSAVGLDPIRDWREALAEALPLMSARLLAVDS
jgi:dTDP-4-dehydrorhamnose reductase